MFTLTSFSTVLLLTLAQSAPEIDSKLEAAFGKSIQYERLLNYDDAVKALTALPAAQQKGYLVQIRLGWLQYKGGKYAAAREAYEAAIRVSPKSTEARLGLILVVLAEGKFEDAENRARQILSTDPGNYYANLRLGYALRMQSKFTQAEEVDNRLVEAFPTDVSALLELGLTKVGLKQKDAAAKVFLKVLLLDPDNAIANQQLGRTGEKKNAG